MKLWYQAMVGEELWGEYPAALRAIIDSVKDPGTTVEVHGIRKAGGAGTQYRYLEYIQTGEILENLHQAMRQGFDGFLIGNIADPGVREAREIAGFPVLGLCETSMYAACMMGATFSFVSINEKFNPRLRENVVRAGLESRLAGIHPMRIDRTLDMDKGFSDPAVRQRIVDRFLEAANTAVGQGAEVLIPAGGVPMAVLAQAGVHAASRSAAVLNGIVALVKMGEAAVKMDKIMGGHFISKSLSYAPPGRGQIKEFRRLYGHVYPTVEEDDA
ncbi:aspartate/glutamate racemase family protein [Pigmentiphaga soli]|uniref:Aspartate/glutamate racemase family protein n=1 Tax=Pigmentiphaga soli TaxID=1007095 RepID=A0ABP8GD18_9BURK